jgi:hypothetical protein
MEERAARTARPRRQCTNGRNADRRLALLKRMGLYGSDMQGARITRATTVEDLLGAYRLVHDIFVQQGYIRPDETGVRIRPFEALPETATFVAKADGRVVGVTSVVIDGPEFGLPTDKAFGAEVDSLRGEGRKLCEGTNWLVAESHRSSGVMTELMRCSFAHALAVGCTDFLGTVSPGHGKFYRLLGFDQPGEVRSYSKEIDDPVVLVRLDLTALGERFRGVTSGDETVESFLKGYYIDDNPYHRHVGTWRILSERLFADPTLLNVLFVQDSRFLPRCDEATRRAVAGRWGPGVFQRVWARQQPVSAG